MILTYKFFYQYPASNSMLFEITLKKLISEFDQLESIKKRYLVLGADFDNSIQYNNFLNLTKKINNCKL